LKSVNEIEKVSSTVTEKMKSIKLPERLRNLSTTYSDVERMGKPPEKLKSHDDDQVENLRCGGYWHGMSMQRNGEYCMHKMHKSYIYTVQRREVLLLEFVVVVASEGDSCVKKKESAATELNRRGSVQ
jgi:hypothetical protein